MANYKISGLAAVWFCLSAAVAMAQNAEQEPDSEDTKPISIMSGATGSYLSSQFAKTNGDVKNAIGYLQRLHKDSPDNIDIAAQLEGMLLLDGRVDEAVAIAANIKQGSQDPITLLLRTLIEVKREDYKAAFHALDPAFENESGQLWLPLISAWLDITQQPMTKPLQLEELVGNVGRVAPIMNYHLALINNSAGFKEAAALNFKESIENPETPPARVMENLLAFYEQNNKPEILTPIVEAYKIANPESDLQPELVSISSSKDGIAEVLFSMGSIMQAVGITQDSIVYLQLALYLKPNLPVAALTLGDAYGEAKLYDKANAAFARVPVGDRNYGRAQLRIAMNLDKNGKLADAIKHLEHLAKQPESAKDALVTKGDLLRMHARFPEAVAAYSKALKNGADEKDWALLFARGSCYERMGNWKLAEADMLRALELKPEQPDVMNYLGFSWLMRGERVAEARDMIERAVQARPNDAQILDSMAWALYLSGHYEEASGYGERAVELLPTDPTVNDHLGDIYWRMGRKNEAKFQWERSLSYKPEAKLADIIRQKMRSGLPDNGMANTPVIASGVQESAPVP